jgi:light-regulated signal transduction histidine kinase (bacteriophytochrome)/CheY-like chemotaxis protein
MTLPRTQAQAEADALDACEAEPIRTPGAVQPHGVVLVTDIDLNRISHISANADTLLPYKPFDLLGKGLPNLLEPKSEHTLRNALSLGTIGSQREYLGRLKMGNRAFQGAVHVRGGHVVFDFSPVREDEALSLNGMDRLRWMLSRATDSLPLREALDGMVRNLRAICGFDRVMAYRFRPDGSGEVIAEARSLAIGSYLNLRFPSFDIPKSARDIALEQPTRIIADTSALPVPIIALDPSAPAFDLTLSEYRGVSPIHLQYLRNMKVGGSLTLPIIVDNALWGLFACHNRTPKFLSIEESMTFDLVGKILNTGISAIIRQTRTEQTAECFRMTKSLSRETVAKPNTLFSSHSWDDAAKRISEMFRADGVQLIAGGRMHSSGMVPPSDTLAEVAAVLHRQGDGRVSCAADLLKGRSSGGPIAGALRLAVGDGDVDGLWIFRAEENQVVTWAGSPEKHVEITAGSPRLHPRSSFSAYTEESRGCSRAWEPEDLMLASSLQEAIAFAIDTQIARDQNEQNLSLMVQELSHRVRNTITLIRALSRQSATGKEDVEEFVASLEQRLLALASAHDLLFSSKSAGISLQEALKRELMIFGEDRFSLCGPGVELSSSAATVMALVLHEMVTNAAKYGALSVPDGTIAVSWMREGQALKLRWQEHSSLRISEPDEKGFGTFLISEGLEHQLDGRSTTEYGDHGVSIYIWLPERHLVWPQAAVLDGAQAEPVSDAVRGADRLRRVLVLEDDFLIAVEHRAFLLEAGIEHVLTANSNTSALRHMRDVLPDAAVVDVNLGTENSHETAAFLKARAIPFIFLTGYSPDAGLLDAFPDVLTLKKPVDAERLFGALAKLMEAKEASRGINADPRP